MIDKRKLNHQARVRPEIRTLLDDVKNSKASLEQTQKQVAEKTRAVDSKRKELLDIQNSSQMNSIRKLKAEKITLERRSKKWRIVSECKDTNAQIESFSVANTAKRSQLVSTLKQLEDELLRKQEENTILVQHAKLLEDILTKRR